MKKFISAFAALLTIFTILPMCSFSAAAMNYAQGWDGDTEGSCLIDDADIFDDETEAGLTESIRAYASTLEMNIVIYVAGKNSYMSDSQTEIFADDTYDEMFGEDTDGIFYFMDFTGKRPAYDYISTSGKAVLNYQKQINAIFNSMDAYLPPSSVSSYADYSEEIYTGIHHFLAELDRRQKKHHSILTYYKDESSGKYFYCRGSKLVITKSIPPGKLLKIFMLSLPIGILVAVIVFLSVKSKYKFKPSTNAGVYISSEKTQRLRWDDNYIRTHTTKTKIESSSGGGHRSGGGGHSHSGGHGGGGHHR